MESEIVPPVQNPEPSETLGLLRRKVEQQRVRADSDRPARSQSRSFDPRTKEDLRRRAFVESLERWIGPLAHYAPETPLDCCLAVSAAVLMLVGIALYLSLDASEAALPAVPTKRVHRHWKWPSQHEQKGLKVELENMVSRIVLEPGHLGVGYAGQASDEPEVVTWRMNAPGSAIGHVPLPHLFFGEEEWGVLRMCSVFISYVVIVPVMHCDIALDLIHTLPLLTPHLSFSTPPTMDVRTEGVTFGISAGNPFSGEEHDIEYNKAINEELYADIRADVHESGIGTPDYIWPWQAYNERTRKKIFGFCVHFAAHPESPRASKAERAMLLHARIYGQATIFKWFPQ